MQTFLSRAATAVFMLTLPLAAWCAGPDVQGIRGIPNLHSVNDQIYRGGQPSTEGFRNLAASGFKTIVDLRDEKDRSKQEKRLVHKLGMHYVNIPMQGMHAPKDKSVSKALKVLSDENAGPVFIHCKRGADRTGVVLACYRMEHDNWSKQEAMNEARGYGMSWYQFPLWRYVASYRPHDSGNFAEDAVDKIKDLPKRASEIFR
jgi:protein tyrosine phosphatase (PTP) superfamily phosphohydrolase (DUF442 family)